MVILPIIIKLCTTVLLQSTLKSFIGQNKGLSISFMLHGVLSPSHTVVHLEAHNCVYREIIFSALLMWNLWCCKVNWLVWDYAMQTCCVALPLCNIDVFGLSLQRDVNAFVLVNLFYTIMSLIIFIPYTNLYIFRHFKSISFFISLPLTFKYIYATSNDFYILTQSWFKYSILATIIWDYVSNINGYRKIKYY